MKIRVQPSKSVQASILLITVLVAVIVAGALGGYLLTVSNENSLVARSQAWNDALVVAEAGIEEGMAMVNIDGPSSASANWPSVASANGWTASGNVYTLTRYVGSSSNYYTVTITNNSSTTVIKSVGTVPWSVGFGGPHTVSRAVLVTNSIGNFFAGAILVKKGIKFTGNTLIDSFNSQDPTYSVNGQYDPSRRHDSGNIATIESNITQAISGVGSTTVYGQAYTGPGDTVKMVGSSSIGDADWVNGGHSGMQEVHDDLNTEIPDAPPAPTWTGTPLTMPKMGINANSILVSSGPGTTNVYNGNISLIGNSSLTITNAAGVASGGTVVVNGSFGAVGNLSVTIAPNVTFVLNTSSKISLTGNTVFNSLAGSTLIMDSTGGADITGNGAVTLGTNANFIGYFGGKLSLTGNAFVGGGNATNTTIYGSPDLDSITVTGNGNFVGTIYAPDTDITGTGGATVIGAIVGNSMKTTGNFNVHYDESLPHQGSVESYRLVSWNEVPP